MKQLITVIIIALVSWGLAEVVTFTSHSVWASLSALSLQIIAVVMALLWQKEIYKI